MTPEDLPERWTAVVNPVAGRGRTRRLLPELCSCLEARGITVHVAEGADETVILAGAAFEAGTGVLACGGDGTIALVAGIAVTTGGVLGVVPTGAGNDLARHLGLDHRRPLGALDLVADGRIAAVDLARACAADGATAWCTTVANAGFDAEANRWANGVRGLTGTPLYLAAVLRTVAVYRPQPIVVRVDDDEWRGDAWLVAVGNTSGYGGGMRIAPSAEIDDGLVDVCVIGATSVTTFVRRFPTVFRGTHVDVDTVTMLRGRRVEIAGDRGDVELELWASGERVGPLPGTVEMVPSALRVLVPARLTRP